MTTPDLANEAIGCAHVWRRCGNGVIANRDISFSVARGEIHAVIGENGAGKTTLMRALYGITPPDEGDVRIGGVVVARPSVAESIARKVGMVHQHFMLVPTLTAAENVVLGQEPRTTFGLFVDEKRAARELGELSARYGLSVDPTRLVSSLSVGEAQRVEILKVLWRGAEVLILDEPTAVLTPPEVAQLFAVLRTLVAGGKTVILVTHKLDEVLALATRVTVLRRGEVVAALDARTTTAAELAHAMIGRDPAPAPPRAQAVAADARERLLVERLSVRRDDGSLAVDDVSLHVRAGEILGIAGVEGNGQAELMLALAGVVAAAGGRVVVDGHDVTAGGVHARQRLGVGHVPDDRLARGVIVDFTLAENVRLGRDALDGDALAAETARIMAQLDVRPPNPQATMAELSGGNQQKLVVGRELGRPPAVLLCAQPTRGVDVGAVERIHAALADARARGQALLLVSADLDELCALSDRIAVLYRGRVVGVVDNGRGPASDGAAGPRDDVRARVGALMLGAAA